jgi:hypothetical protein
MNYDANNIAQKGYKISKINILFILFVILNIHFCQLPGLEDPIQFLIQSIVIRSTLNNKGNSVQQQNTPADSNEDSQDGAVTENLNNSSKDLVISGYYDGNAKIMRIRQDGTVVDEWTKVFDLDGVPGTTELGHDYFRNVKCTGNGDVYLAGIYKGPKTTLDRNTILKKFDKSGTALPGWDKLIDLYNEYDEPWTLTLDQNEDVYLSTRNSNSTFVGESRIFKYQPNGTEFGAPWPNHIIGASAHNFCGGVSVDSSGNIFAGCVRYSATSSSFPDNNVWWIRKWDSNLNEDMENFNIRIANPLGNASGWHNLPYTSILDNDGNFIVAGHMKSPGTIDNDAWYIRKFNKDTGATIWIHSWDYKTNLNNDSEVARGLAVDSDNNTYVVGSLNSVDGDATKHRWAIKKLDTAGNPIAAWTKIIESPTASPDGHSWALWVKIADDGKIYVAGPWGTGSGVTGRKGRIIRFNPDGTEDTSFNPGILDIALYGMDLCSN